MHSASLGEGFLVYCIISITLTVVVWLIVVLKDVPVKAVPKAVDEEEEKMEDKEAAAAVE